MRIHSCRRCVSAGGWNRVFQELIFSHDRPCRAADPPCLLTSPALSAISASIKDKTAAVSKFEALKRRGVVGELTLDKLNSFVF